MLRCCALAAGALLAAFHVWLLAAQVWSGYAAQPEVLLRWLVAGALVAGLVSLWRRGQPVVFGRQAVAVWLLAALLHGPALANDLDGFATPSMPEAAVGLAPSAMTLAALGLVLLALWIRPTRPGTTPRVVALSAFRLTSPALVAASGLGFLPRPPPLR
jgi:hypothetical protein